MTEGTFNRQSGQLTQLFLISSDPIFQLGLRTGLEQNSAFQVLGAAPSSSELWSTLAALSTPDIFILDLDSLGTVARASVNLCYQLKNSYPQQPILVIANHSDWSLLQQLQQIGVNGYLPKGTDFQPLYRVLDRLMQGESAWVAGPMSTQAPAGSGSLGRPTGLHRIKTYLRRTSLKQIQSRRLQVTQDLNSEYITGWEWVVLSGQLREIKAAQFLINQLFPNEEPEPADSTNNLPTAPSPGWSISAIAALSKQSGSVLQSGPEALPSDDLYRTIKSAVLDQLTAKLPLASVNLTGTPLEVDVLRADRKQELYLVVLKQFEVLLDELRFSGVSRSQLFEKQAQMVFDLWQNALTDFLGKYRTLSLESGTISGASPVSIEVVPTLLIDGPVVADSILSRIPLFAELVDHLLFHSDLLFDQQVYPVGSVEAFLQTESLLSNGVIQVANAVVQPLVNRFSSYDAIRRDFFDRRWLSTREIERFRNALSWKYRVQQWFVEPKDIFESQFRLMVFSETGIKYRAVYAPRDRELQGLSGVPFIITLALETRDAIAPPIQAVVTFVGRGFVYLLTQVIGRSIGLVGRGVLQGVGYVRSEVRRPSQSADQRHL